MGILICGLNGSGKSTLGRMLADRIGFGIIILGLNDCLSIEGEERK